MTPAVDGQQSIKPNKVLQLTDADVAKAVVLNQLYTRVKSTTQDDSIGLWGREIELTSSCTVSSTENEQPLSYVQKSDLV